MALTDYQAEALLTSTPFLQRVALNLGIICQNIESESAGTALHAQRVRLANQIITGTGGNPASAPIVAEFAEQVLTQLNLSTTSLVTVNGVANADVDTTDASLQTVISSIYNDFISS
jgi:hypothetical protein